MKQFLLVFDRSKGALIKLTEYSVRSEALQARFDVERLHRHDPSIEVVVLSARSEGDLGRTHARYFEDTPQIAHRGLKSLSETG
jgi:hypothetical protein